jgi:hypothetical protein
MISSTSVHDGNVPPLTMITIGSGCRSPSRREEIRTLPRERVRSREPHAINPTTTVNQPSRTDATRESFVTERALARDQFTHCSRHLLNVHHVRCFSERPGCARKYEPPILKSRRDHRWRSRLEMYVPRGDGCASLPATKNALSTVSIVSPYLNVRFSMSRCQLQDASDAS